MDIGWRAAALAAVAVTATTALVAQDASAQERVRWKMQSAFGSNLSHLGTSGVRVEEMVDRLSGGNFELKFFEPGALVPALECFDAASQGSVDACWTTRRLPHRQVSGAGVLHRGAVRSRFR